MLKIYKGLPKPWFMFLFGALLGCILGLGLVGYYYKPDKEYVEDLEKVKTLLEEQNKILKEELIDVLKNRQEQMEYILDLSMKFAFDPKITLLVDKYSREYVDSHSKWKLIETHENMTHWMLSLITVESNGNTHAVSSKGALGLTQLMLNTAKMYEPEVTRNQLFDQETNVKIAFKHFSYLLNKYEGNLLEAFDAWNRGETRVDTLKKAGQFTGNGFARKIYAVAALR